MTATFGTSSDRAAESLLAFWAEAGVDAMLLDEAIDRIEAGRFIPPAPEKKLVIAPRATPSPTSPAVPDIGHARALAKAATTLEALSEAISAYEGCTLRFEGAARQAVFSRGSPQAPVLIVGEAPGAEEDARGEPFVGRAGQLLDRMLAAAGLADRVFITNTVFWRPPGNRTPTPQEQAQCAPFVERAIELVNPRILLFVGAAAARSMLGREEGILQLRGRWFEWRSSDHSLEKPALPTLHPAFLLRQPLAKKKAWSDLLTLRERLDRPLRPA